MKQDKERKYNKMKEMLKRIAVTVTAAAMSLMICAVSVSASSSTARPQPDGSGSTAATDTMETSQGEESAPEVQPTQMASSVGTVSTVTQNAGSETSGQRSYQTKLGGFLWFLLSVVVNFVLSCWIGNRFYRLAKRSNQSSAEIRALRKDIEEKFGSTLHDISESAAEIMNQNENYSRSDEGLEMPERKTKVEINDEEREMLRRWDEQRAGSRSARPARPVREEEPEDDLYDEDEEEEEYRRAPRSSSAYRPTRRSSGIEFDDEDEDDYYDDYEDERRDRRRSPRDRDRRMSDRRTETAKKNINKAKGKAKDFLSNVFPFED